MDEVKLVRVKWIEFKNNESGLKIERIYFNRDITLLVGLSGAGKTQILNAVEYSLNFAIRNDIILRPYNVHVGIEIGEDIYEWNYNIQKDSKAQILFDSHEKYYIAEESLLKNGECIFARSNNKVEVIGYQGVPQPKKDESLLLQYSEDEQFEKLISGIRKLYSVEMEIAVRGGVPSDVFGDMKSMVKSRMNRDKKPDFRIFSHLSVPYKIYIAKNFYYEEIFVKIFSAVKELFMEIEDIDVIEDRNRDMYLVSIDVYGHRLLQHDISNGMLKSIYYIVELYTMPENSLVLIDEFENGLGVNCIDVLSDLILNERNDLQFIITSHHPKIINQIEKNKWKIIERNLETVKNIGSNEFGIGNSQHDAYFNLVNRWEFEGKI